MATIKLAQERRRLFSNGPGADGHYLHGIRLQATT